MASLLAVNSLAAPAYGAPIADPGDGVGELECHTLAPHARLHRQAHSRRTEGGRESSGRSARRELVEGGWRRWRVPASQAMTSPGERRETARRGHPAPNGATSEAAFALRRASAPRGTDEDNDTAVGAVRRCREPKSWCCALPVG